MVLSNEVAGGVGAETAMASGQVDMAGAWYVHTINFQLQGKAVVDVAQLSGSPGERIMCATGTHITSPTQWKGQSIGVTDLGSGTDQLTQYLAARYGLKKGDYTRIAAGDGSTMIAALQHHKILCGMTTQPTVAAIEKLGVGYPAFDLTTTAGVQEVARRLHAHRGRARADQLGERQQGHGAEGRRRASSPPCTGSPRTARPTSPTCCRRAS